MSMQQLASMPPMTRLEEACAGDFEIAFMCLMAEHHAGLVQMSEQALREARSARCAPPPLKQEARQVLDEQRKEMTQVTVRLPSWYWRGPVPELREMMRRDMPPSMASFREKCARNCNLTFLSHMKHHQMGIDMARMALEKSIHRERKAFVRKTPEGQVCDINHSDN